MKIAGQIWSWFIGGAVVIGAVYFFIVNQNPAGANLTIYPIQCQNPATSINNCTNPQRVDRVAYKIDTKNNQVVYWNPDTGESNISYSNGNNCAIADANNWSCQSSGLSYGVNNGKYFDNRDTNMIFATAVDWNSIKTNGTSDYPSQTTSSNTSGYTDITSNVQIQCNFGSKKTISGLDSGITFTQSDFDSNGNFIGHDKNAQIQTACGITEAESMAELQKFANGDTNEALFNVVFVK